MLLPSMLLGIWVFCAGCSESPPSLKMPNLDPAAIGQEALKRYDANSDGKLDAKELEKSPALAALLVTVKKQDSGHADSLTAEDIAARVESWMRGGIVLLGGGSWVTLDGKPLEGALVTWEPEPYLGSNYHPLSGTTRSSGYAAISPALEGFPGIYPGLYTVRISRKVEGRETIPARYNEKSILGREVAPDVPDSHGLFHFDLKSN
jgi:hypothetical protein